MTFEFETTIVLEAKSGYEAWDKFEELVKQKPQNIINATVLGEIKRGKIALDS
jgi:rRNA-processing protein FCF1